MKTSNHTIQTIAFRVNDGIEKRRALQRVQKGTHVKLHSKIRDINKFRKGL